MARSLKKGPYVHYKLERKVMANVEAWHELMLHEVQIMKG